MSAKTLTICVPTIGRPGLKDTLDSIARQALIPGDRVLVVLDTYNEVPRPDIAELVASYGEPFELHGFDGGVHFFGNPQFNYAMTLADTDFFCGLGDDDIYVDGAIERLRPQLEDGRAALIQFLSPFFPTPAGLRRFVLWDEPVLRVSHISGCCLVAPVASLVPVGPARRIEIDFDWIEAVVKQTGHEPVWVRDCLIIARPARRNGELVHAGVTTCCDCRTPQYLEDVDASSRCPHCAKRVRAATPVTRPLRVLLAHPGASWSTADVYDGLYYGLQQHGVSVEPYRLDTRIEASHKALHWLWRTKKKTRPDLAKPNEADVIYHAGIGVLEMALRQQVDAVIVVSAMLLHPDVIVMMKRAGLRVTVLFTESPYDHEHEMRIAAMVDGCWTNERACVPAFRTVNAHAGYLPHAWHPEKHYVSSRQIAELPEHDVVFVGTGFSERVTWFNAIDWTGIDLGLYGTWAGLGLNKSVKACVRSTPIANETAGALYRRAKVGLNLYRRSRGWAKDAEQITHAESLSPRAYELAACGAFHLSDYREEVREVFGYLVPTFTTPAEAEALIRLWLKDPDGRQRAAEQLPACVAESSWSVRAKTVVADLSRLIHEQAA